MGSAADAERSGRGTHRPDMVEEAVVALRRNRDRLLDLLPCTLVVHLPPAGSRKEVELEVTSRLR